MAFGSSRLYCSLHWNLFSIDHIEDELVRDPGHADSFHLDSTSPAPSYNPILGPVLIFVLIPALTPTLPSSDELFKQFMSAYLKSNQEPRQPLTEWKQSFKAKVPDIYYEKLYIDYYHFYQQCEDYFEIAGTIGTKQTLFATFFLYGNISMR